MLAYYERLQHFDGIIGADTDTFSGVIIFSKPICFQSVN